MGVGGWGIRELGVGSWGLGNKRNSGLILTYFQTYQNSELKTRNSELGTDLALSTQHLKMERIKVNQLLF
uniref:Uncharacterized protein n=1 Tax=Desertifilum tharense IPPAS B-1220 TaxID=1781255 RepID=A0ACD5H1N7_9CYAN